MHFSVLTKSSHIIYHSFFRWNQIFLHELSCCHAIIGENAIDELQNLFQIKNKQFLFSACDCVPWLMDTEMQSMHSCLLITVCLVFSMFTMFKCFCEHLEDLIQFCKAPPSTIFQLIKIINLLSAATKCICVQFVFLKWKPLDSRWNDSHASFLAAFSHSPFLFESQMYTYGRHHIIVCIIHL